MVLLLVPFAAAATSSSPRTVQSFNFGWRWGPIDKPKPAPPSPPKGCAGKFEFTQNDGKQCAGLSHITKGDASEAACKAACCEDNGCGDYQWRDPKISGGGCWAGVCYQMNDSPPWRGGHRNPPIAPPTPSPPPGANPPQAQPGFDDSHWDIVSTPHDALISQAPSKELCSSGCRGHSCRFFKSREARPFVCRNHHRHHHQLLLTHQPPDNSTF